MTNKICKISLFSVILATVSTVPSFSAVKAKNSNRSYANAYGQVNALRYQQEYLDANATTASAAANLPVMVTDEKLANAILNNTSETTSLSDLSACAMIYPNGVFRWDIPESGVRRNQTNQCVSVVSLIDANTNAVLATTTVAAGDTFKCNIDNFPESGMNAVALSQTELPADIAPTMADVESVMNEEQKQNAGFKIAAGAIIAGVAGNALSKKEAGATSMFGTGKDQLIGTAAGVAAGAGIMAASSYSGKVAGDTINSTAVNAASGMIVGNMLAGANTGSAILDIKRCTISEGDFAGEHDCIAGRAQEKDSNWTFEDGKIYLVNKNGTARECSANNDDTYNCSATISLFDIELETASGPKKFEEIFGDDVKDSEFASLVKYSKINGDNAKFQVTNNIEDDQYYKIASATKASDTQQHAYIVFKNDVKSTYGGIKKSKFNTLTKGKTAGTDYAYFKRNTSSGTVGDAIATDANQIYFTPASIDASSGGLVDLNNQARTSGTLVGTATGGAMGGFAGYQGAKSEITDRWTAAVREYEDSLSNFVCMTGTRYLSKYNDYVEIPELKKSE